MQTKEQKRAYYRDYMRRNGDQRKKCVVRNIARLRDRRARLINEHKSKPCMDCGLTFHYSAMDFDHRPGTKKVGCLTTMIHRGASWERIEAEIAKCDVVCSNCHRVRTWTRIQAKRRPISRTHA